MLCGTNCFAIGNGSNRVLIDACKKDHDVFLKNVACFVTEQNCYIESILITHSHYDHMDGAMNLIELMESLGLQTPKVYKRLDGNPSELERFKNSPGLENHVLHTEEGSKFEI